jgi:hypothetical protein
MKVLDLQHAQKKKTDGPFKIRSNQMVAQILYPYYGIVEGVHITRPHSQWRLGQMPPP